MCNHNKVTIYSRQIAPVTRYEPAEYRQWAQCNECGEVLDLSDVSADAEAREGDAEYWDVPERDDAL
jgi:hypothetical protein